MTDESGVVRHVGAGRVAARTYGRPSVRRHALALLALLLILVPVVGTDSAFVTDESFVVIQLETIERTGAWEVQHPLPEVDPTGIGFPLHGASRNEAGYVLYGKHPALIYLYLPVHRAFGVVGLMLISVLGTWGSALVAAALARRFHPGSEVVALWLVGAASPLFFDAFVVHAHTLAAASAGLATVLALRSSDGGRVGATMGMVMAVLSTALLRTEGVIFAFALGGALGAAGFLRRRAGMLLLGACSGGAGVAALFIDRWWATIVASGAPRPVEVTTWSAVSFLEGRRSSLAYTLLMPGYRGVAAEAVALVGVALVISGVIIARKRPEDVGARYLPLLGAALVLTRPFLGWGPIPGLLVAFACGVSGLLLLRGPMMRAADTRLALASAGLFVAGVALTQYPSGGHTEWGGRYFALVLPTVGAVSAAGLVQAVRDLPRPTSRALGASLLGCALGLGALAIVTLRSSHDHNRHRTDGVLAAAREVGRGPGEPVVLTEDDQVPRLARGRFGEVRWLLVQPRTIGGYLDRLAEEQVENVLVVSIDPSTTLSVLPPTYEQVGATVPHDLQYGAGGGLIRLRLRQEVQ